MSLRDLKLKISYGPHDNGLREFFIPAMTASVRYDRAAGYFSSSMLAVAAAGVSQLVLNGGKMRLLCGADLSEKDVEAIRRGEELAEKLANRMKMRLFWPEDKLIQDRLEAMAWMVATRQLEIKVVLPTDGEGHPLPASKTNSYYHPKEGLFLDAEGNSIGFSGSVNESATALEDNYESFMVFDSWKTSAHLAQIRHRFDRLWEGREQDWIALPIPEAVKQELLKYRPAGPPPREPGVDGELEEVEDTDEQGEVSINADQRERIIFQFLRDVPHLLNADRLGMATCTVTPWPHQTVVSDTIIKSFPERFLLCDEVGLGKTIEAGLAIRQLVLSGAVRRALILTPKSVLVQWQEELYEKFVLNIPRYDGSTFYDVFGREIPGNGDGNPWDAHPIFLASSHLAKRRERQPQLLDADGWDLVVVDEAHHARRKDFQNREQFRPNRLLELLLGPQGLPGLADKTRGLLLLTATPMQVDPIEVFDLLKLLGMGGKWGVGSNFLGYFTELQRPFEDIDWHFVLGMLRDYFDTGGPWNEHFRHVAEERLGPVVWDQLERLPWSTSADSTVRQLNEQGQAMLRQMAALHTPLRRHLFRNTRALLREYHRRGLLKENIPDRDPRPEWIDMKPDEEKLYKRIEEYIRNHYQKYEAERRGLGFIMTVYRRRLTSSFHAIQESLARRLRYLKGETAEDWLADEDVEQDDLDTDVSELLVINDHDPHAEAEETLHLFADEIDYVQDFISELKALGTDSKFEQLAGDLAEILCRRDSVIVFTQYTDTMDYLRDKLRHVYGGQVACYSGRGGERWDGDKWIGTTKEHIKTTFRESKEIKILLCTESASEGLNLQTCGVLINYEMPWNPMRVEQRIGRIDRIGQVHQRVWIRNYFYQGTVEAIVYQRLDDRITSFESVVGELQPILSRIARIIEAAAMANDRKRGELIAKEVEEINRQVRSAQVSALDLDRFAAENAEAVAEEPSPVELSELERVIVESSAFRNRLQPHPEIAGAHLLDWHGSWQPITFSPALFDEHPSTLKLLTYGHGMLEEMLEAVSRPPTNHVGGLLARCWTERPTPLVGYYTAGVTRLPGLGAIQSLLASGDQNAVAEGEQVKIKADFAAAKESVVQRESSSDEGRHLARESSLVEEIRQLLQEAAYVELARAHQRDLFDQSVQLDFSPQTYEHLRRQKVPFAGAMRLVGNDLPSLRPEDPLYLNLRDARKDVLTRRFEGTRTRLINSLRRLVELRRVHTERGQRTAASNTPTFLEYLGGAH